MKLCSIGEHQSPAVSTRLAAGFHGLFFSCSRTMREWQRCKWVPRRTETNDLNTWNLSTSAHIFLLLSMAQLHFYYSQILFVLGNMATGAYKFHTWELSWMENNVLTFSAQVERNSYKRFWLDKLGSVALLNDQLSSCRCSSGGYFVGKTVVLNSYSNRIKSNGGGREQNLK